MTGFVIGKFCPPHLGHDHVIRTALAATDNLIIIVCGKKTQPIVLGLRIQWLKEMYPQADIRVLNQDLFDDTNEEAWTAATKQCLGTVPDLMFSSEDYGDHYAHLLGCKHVLVDKERNIVPISASKILTSPLEFQQYLLPPARAWFRSQDRPSPLPETRR